MYFVFVNECLSFDYLECEFLIGQFVVLFDIDIEMYKRVDFGLLIYDMYVDGSGVCYSFYYCLIMNMWLRYRMLSFDVVLGLVVDLFIIVWLDQSGFDYEVLIDEDFYCDGLEVLLLYVCVVSGLCLEYYIE